MRKWMFILALGTALTATQALANPITWTVNGTFADGATITGSFVYDVDTFVVSSWNIVVAGGNTGTFPNYTYSTHPSGALYNGFSYPEVQFAFDSDTSRVLILSSPSPLTNAGGTVNLITYVNDSNFSGECFNCVPSRFLESGTLTASAADSSVPEPATLPLVTGALASAGWLHRRRRQ